MHRAPVHCQNFETVQDWLACKRVTRGDACAQKEAWDFEAFLAHSCGDSPVTKLGEGQFGEAYLCRDFVMKVVPMEGDIEVNGEPQKMAGDQLNEAMIGLALSGLRVPTAPLDDPSGALPRMPCACAKV